MNETSRQLSTPPDANTIEDLRSRASNHDESVQVTFPAADGEQKRLVVSPRGTCVLLNDTREASFIPSVPANDVAAALHE